MKTLKQTIDESLNEAKDIITVKDNPELKKYGIKELRDGYTLKKLKNMYPWILDAKIKDAVIGGTDPDNETQYLSWYDGTWIDGKFYGDEYEVDDVYYYGGKWWSGTWKGGTWKGNKWSWLDKKNQFPG